MELLNFLKILTNDSPNLCYFSDFDSQELVFINQAIERKFQIFEDYGGKNFSQVLGNFLPPIDSSMKEAAERGEEVQGTCYCEYLDIYLNSHTAVMELCGRKLLFNKYFLTNFEVEQTGSKQSFEEATKKCMELVAIPDKEEAIMGLLHLLGEYYSGETACVYEFDCENFQTLRSYSWFSQDNTTLPPKKDDSEHLSAFLKWMDREADLVNLESLEDSDISDSEKYDFFTRYQIFNLTMYKLKSENGSMVGLIGVSNRKTQLQDNRLLKAVSFFIEERFKEINTSLTLKKMEELDSLTGFFNRSKYAERLSEIHNNRPKSLGVLFVNLNGLRKTNEYLGFEVGDVQIKQTTSVLRSFFTGDFYRISGDEFVGFRADCEKAEFEDSVNKLQLKLKEDHHESSFSLGHSWASGSYSISDLIKTADTVMVINKQAFYSNTFQENKEVSNKILQDLFQAIAEDEFLLYLQPQVNLQNDTVVGAEALIRRFDKKADKMIFPDQFIPFYEKNSVIRHVDLFVVRKSCLILLEWLHLERAIPISVNLSRVTLMEHGIVNTISNILDEYHIPHELIIIEVTERIGMVENEVASSLVEEFKSRGFKLSLDDFGCAYSNIVTLATLTVDEIKIDKSLVDHITTNPKNAMIVQYMLAMCNDLEDTHTLAEGIETEEQAEFLRLANCHLGQGYLYSRPIPNQEFFLKYIQACPQ